MPTLDSVLGECDLKHWGRRAAAVRELGGWMSDERARARLMLALRDGNAVVRANAIESLGRGGASLGRGVAMRGLADPSWVTRRAAVRVLGALAPEERSEWALSAQYREERDWRIRLEIVRAFVRPSGATEQARQTLAAAAREVVSAVRCAALEALGRLGVSGGVEVAAASVQALDVETRQSAVAALAGIGVPEVLDALTLAARDPKWGVRHSATEALRRLGLGPRRGPKGRAAHGGAEVSLTAAPPGPLVERRR